jgi:formamidopyrimidine-DNA glycosylase
MPELPEVEAVRRNLANELEGATIRAIESSGVHRGVADKAISIIGGSRIEAVARKGKFLLLDLGTKILVMHLGMSGRLLICDVDSYAVGRHDHVRFALGNERVLVFQDHRRFGRVFLSPRDLSALPKLGPDALEAPLTAERLQRVLRSRRTAIKVALMEQSVVAGLGNIYACETLWAAGIAPSRAASGLTLAECQQLIAAMDDILRRAVAVGGATLDDYRGTAGEMGTFDATFAVYARSRMPCLRCSATVDATTIAGRTTYWCPGCQS